MRGCTSKNIAREILDNIENERIILSKRDKNMDFIKKYSLLQADIEEIVYSLKENNFVEKIENKDSKIKANFLYIFNPVVSFNDIYGKVVKKLYIKICKIVEGIFVVSLHE